MICSFVIAKLYFYLSFFFHFYLLISFPPNSAIRFLSFFLSLHQLPLLSYLFFLHNVIVSHTSVDLNHLATIHKGSILPAVNAHQRLTILPPNIRVLYFTCCHRCPSATSVSWYSWPHSDIPPLSTDPHLQWWISHPHPMAHTPREGQVKKMN